MNKLIKYLSQHLFKKELLSLIIKYREPIIKREVFNNKKRNY